MTTVVVVVLTTVCGHIRVIVYRTIITIISPMPTIVYSVTFSTIVVTLCSLIYVIVGSIATNITYTCLIPSMLACISAIII